MDISRLNLPPIIQREKLLFLWLGSTICNLRPNNSLKFLQQIHVWYVEDGRVGGGILIGADLVKDQFIVDLAYNDTLGLMAILNQNFLRHLNHEFKMNFDVRNWRHLASFIVKKQRMEMHVQAISAEIVSRGEHYLKAGDTILTKYSYKYTIEQFVAMLMKAGFTDSKIWSNPQNWFLVCHARAKTASPENLQLDTPISYIKIFGLIHHLGMLMTSFFDRYISLRVIRKMTWRIICLTKCYPKRHCRSRSARQI